MERPLDFDPTGVPVDVDLLVYTDQEWDEVLLRGDRFADQMTRVVWI